MDTTLNIKESYAAMFLFLDDLSRSMGNNAEIGGILGSMSLLSDGMPADHALWPMWMDAVEKAKGGEAEISLKLSR